MEKGAGMTVRLSVAAGLVLLTVCAGSVGAQVTAEQIDKSVARGVESLLKTQRADGSWGDYDSGIPDFANAFRGFGRRGPGRGFGPGPERFNEDMGTVNFEHGKTVAGLLGLAYSGTDVTDKRLQKALDLVLAVEVTKNYVLGMRVLALARLHGRLPANRQATARAVIAKDVAALAANQNERGLWSYGQAQRDSDMGDTAMAIAALAESAGVMTPKDGSLWKQSLASLMEHQRDDGQWDYLQMNLGPMGPMDFGSTTVNGVAGLLALRTVVIRGGGCPCRDGKSATLGEEVTRAIDRGLEQIGKDNPSGGGNQRRGIGEAEWAFFWARSGALSGYRTLGNGPWYPRMAAAVLGRQQDDGGWGDTVRTGLSLAALAIGREPALVTKARLQGQTWNAHPDDLAALVGYVASQRKEALRWQIMDLESKVEDLHESPILYLFVEGSPTLSDEQRKRLREFTDTGGTVFLESSCGDKAAVEWCTKLCGQVWSEWPLATLAKEHALWSADQKMGVRHPALRGVDDGLRTCVLVSDQDLSCTWALGDLRANREPFRLGQNLYAYTTDRGTLRSKWQTPEPADTRYTAQTPKRGSKDRVTVARVKHAGDWAVGRNYRPWDLLAKTTLGKIGLEVMEREAIEIGQDVPAEVDLVHLAGRQSCDLGQSGAAWLKKVVSGGKFLLVEAALGDARFNESARTALAAAGLEIRLLPADAPPVTGQLFEATGFKLDQVRYTTGLEAERKRKEVPSLPGGGAWPEGRQVALYGLYAGKELVGIYTPFDIVFSQTGCQAFGNLGYGPEDARAIAANVLLLTSIRAAATK